MAKKNPDVKDAQVVEEAAPVAAPLMVVSKGGALTAPSYLEADTELNQKFATSEIKLPMLRIVQDTTPQRKRGSSSYIEGLNAGDLFNDLTKENYGQGPLQVVPLKFWVSYVKFHPIDEGGGIICRDSKNGGSCPFPCPKATTWGAEGEKPECTLFFNYLFFLPKTGETVWFSAKSTGLKPMKLFNSALRMPNVIAYPDYAKVLELTTVLEEDTKAKTSWYAPSTSFVIGFAPEESLPQLKALTISYKDAVVDTSRAETLDEEDTLAAAEAPTAARTGDSKIPF